jgi:hypothetical protein
VPLNTVQTGAVPRGAGITLRNAVKDELEYARIELDLTCHCAYLNRIEDSPFTGNDAVLVIERAPLRPRYHGWHVLQQYPELGLPRREAGQPAVRPQ